MRSATPDRALLAYLALFSSVGTLFCCALPSLLVLIGLGATVAGFLSAFPWLVSLSHHKNWVFEISGLLIGGNFIYVYGWAPRLRAQVNGCSMDAPDACSKASKGSRVALWLSAGLYGIGVFSVYVLGPLLMRFDS